MARRGPTSKEKEKEPEVVEAEAQPTEGESTEAPAEDKSKSEKLDAFKEVATGVFNERDEVSGDLTDEQLAKVTEAFRKLDGQKLRNAAKTYAEEQMTVVIQPPIESIEQARAWVKIKDAMTPAAGAKPRTPADPTEAYIQNVYTVRLAAQLLADNKPDGLAEDWEEKLKTFTEEHAAEVEAYLAWQADTSENRGDEPELAQPVRKAFKAATTKVRKSNGTRRQHTGKKRDVNTHIAQVFAEKEVGTFLTVQEIANASSAEYGDDPNNPSPGAVSQRLFSPKGGLPDGIEPVSIKPRGAKKVA